METIADIVVRYLRSLPVVSVQAVILCARTHNSSALEIYRGLEYSIFEFHDGSRLKLTKRTAFKI